MIIHPLLIIWQGEPGSLVTYILLKKKLTFWIQKSQIGPSSPSNFATVLIFGHRDLYFSRSKNQWLQVLRLATKNLVTWRIYMFLPGFKTQDWTENQLILDDRLIDSSISISIIQSGNPTERRQPSIELRSKFCLYKRRIYLPLRAQTKKNIPLRIQDSIIYRKNMFGGITSWHWVRGDLRFRQSNLRLNTTFLTRVTS